MPPTSHEIEPELRGPVPRPVQHRAGRAALVVHGLIALWLIPFALIGLGLLVFVAYRTLLWQTQHVSYGNLEAGWIMALGWNAAMFSPSATPCSTPAAASPSTPPEPRPSGASPASAS